MSLLRIRSVTSPSPGQPHEPEPYACCTSQILARDHRRPGAAKILAGASAGMPLNLDWTGPSIFMHPRVNCCSRFFTQAFLDRLNKVCGMHVVSEYPVSIQIPPQYFNSIHQMPYL
ncbi:hypothetical protein ABZX51_010857 [Aspergillus tubingensis]